ncbi:hypothetical protein LINGRAHAP2_LOCUS36411 [Linum grandiflorum]
MIPLINVCPRLHTLRLLVSFLFQSDSLGRFSLDVVKLRRNSVKVVEVVGFRGRELDSEFMDYVFEYFGGLETIIIDCSR